MADFPEAALRRGAVPVVGFVVGRSTGGIGRHVRSVAAALTDAGQPPYVLAPADVLERFGFADVAAVTATQVGEFRSYAAAKHGVRRLFESCDVVHAHGLRAGAITARSRRVPGAAFVQTWHNTPPTRGAAGRFSAALSSVSARAADVTIGVSPDLVQLATDSGSRDARWLPVAAPALPQPTRSAADVRAELGVGSAQLVLAIGRLAEQKGFDVLAEAAEILADDTSQPVIVIAGEGPERGRLSGRAVTLLGDRKDVAALIAAADLVVMPSRWEGWPLAAQETLRAGRALIATPVGGLPLLAGDAALWVPVDDPPRLAAAIRRLLADGAARERLEAAALIRAQTLPDEAATCAALFEVYEAVTGRAR